MRKYKGVKPGGGNELQPYDNEGKYGNDGALTELILQLSSSPQKALKAYLDYNSIRITQHCAERINERGIGPGDILRTLMAPIETLEGSSNEGLGRSVKLVGPLITVVMNEQKSSLITIYKNNRSKRKRLENRYALK